MQSFQLRTCGSATTRSPSTKRCCVRRSMSTGAGPTPERRHTSPQNGWSPESPKAEFWQIFVTLLCLSSHVSQHGIIGSRCSRTADMSSAGSSATASAATMPKLCRVCACVKRRGERTKEGDHHGWATGQQARCHGPCQPHITPVSKPYGTNGTATYTIMTRRVNSLKTDNV